MGQGNWVPKMLRLVQRYSRFGVSLLSYVLPATKFLLWCTHMATVTIWEASGANGGKKASLEQLTALLTQGEVCGVVPAMCHAPCTHAIGGV